MLSMKRNEKMWVTPYPINMTFELLAYLLCSAYNEVKTPNLKKKWLYIVFHIVANTFTLTQIGC